LNVDNINESRNYEVKKLLKNEDWSGAFNMRSSCKMHGSLLFGMFLTGLLQSSVKFCWGVG
jgi:hypothetical protein